MLEFTECRCELLPSSVVIEEKKVSAELVLYQNYYSAVIPLYTHTHKHMNIINQQKASSSCTDSIIPTEKVQFNADRNPVLSGL